MTLIHPSLDTRPQRATRANSPIFQLIAKDYNRESSESWEWLAVLHYTGELERDDEGGDTIHEEQVADIYRFLAAYDIHVASAGAGEAGQPFANEPWIRFYPHHLIITQGGGRDV